MLMHVVWDWADASEAGGARALEVFQGWKPPPGADFQAFYGFADGDGGVAIIEVDSAATLARAVAHPTEQVQVPSITACYRRGGAISRHERASGGVRARCG